MHPVALVEDHVRTSGWPTNTELVLAVSKTFGADDWIGGLAGVDIPPTGVGFTTLTPAVPVVDTSATPINEIN
jgi:hypothetical protein